MASIAHLLQKYDVQGPRYTSYPTVPYWDTTPTVDQWIQHLRAELNTSRAAGRGAAIYLHLPYCEQLCTFCACNRVITKKHERVAPYTQALLGEWALYKKALEFDKLPVAEVHLGGGTPTFFSPDELQTLLQPLLADCALLPDAELSLEADPRVTTREHLQVLNSFGFKRLSLGVQDYDPVVQTAINRVQSVEMVTGLCKTARAAGFDNINFDLVYGLPKQTAEGMRQTVESVIAQRPDRIAFYAYAHVPWVGLTGQRGFDESDLPTGADKRAFFDAARNAFLAAGYADIGMDHFALPHDDLHKATRQGTLFRNFMGYVPRHVSPLIGLGCSAISDAWTCFAQNEKDDKAYQAAIAAGRLPLVRGHVLDAEDLERRHHILNLMTRFETTWANAPRAVLDLLAEAVVDGLVTCDGPTVRITDAGKPFIRNICMAFDARLQRKQPETQIFSRTV